MTHLDLMAGPPHPPPRGPGRGGARRGDAPRDVVRRHPASPLAWAALAEEARDQDADDVTVYAYARVGYHRSLDLLRRNGWKGHGPVPWEHEPNRGFLRCLALLALAARAIGETEEWERCSDVPARLQPRGVRRAAGLSAVRPPGAPAPRGSGDGAHARGPRPGPRPTSAQPAPLSRPAASAPGRAQRHDSVGRRGPRSASTSRW